MALPTSRLWSYVQGMGTTYAANPPDGIELGFYRRCYQRVKLRSKEKFG